MPSGWVRGLKRLPCAPGPSISRKAHVSSSQRKSSAARGFMRVRWSAGLDTGPDRGFGQQTERLVHPSSHIGIDGLVSGRFSRATFKFSCTSRIRADPRTVLNKGGGSHQVGIK